MTPRYTLAFASGADYVNCGDIATGGKLELTVEAVARVDAVGLNNRPLLAKYAAGAAEWSLHVTADGRLYFVVYDLNGGNSTAWSAAGAAPAGKWRHFAGCLDAVGGAMQVFVDGVDVTEGALVTGNAAANTATPVRLGGVLGDLAAGFVGRLAWAAVWEIVRYRQDFVPSYVAPQAYWPTVALWGLTEGAGADVAGGTITGAQWGLWGGCGARNGLLDHVLGGPNYTRPATLYLGLGLDNPLTPADEVTGGGYARQAVTNNAANWPAASAGAKACAAAFTFPPATADWGSVRTYGLWDAASGGNLVQWGTLNKPYPVRAGAQLRLAAQALSVGAW